MRRRRPAKLRLKRDMEATAAMCFEERDSYVHLSGRHIYVGADAAKARATAYRAWQAAGRQCAICKQPVRGEPDWDHIIPKGPHGCRRDDHPRNRQFVHSMFDYADPCHRNKHNREVRWTPRAEEAGAA